MADELIQGTVTVEPQRGAVARYLVTFYPAPPDHRPCVKSEEGFCFAKSLSKNELLGAFLEAEIWLKYTPLNELAGKAFVCVIRTSTHDRLFRS